MGTRADFYVGRGGDSEWIGSVSSDGFPDSIPGEILNAVYEKRFRHAVRRYSLTSPRWTHPSQGWPWPWGDSCTTDYAYAFDNHNVWASNFGSEWWPARGKQPELGEDGYDRVTFPSMERLRKIALPGSARSGLIVLGDRE